MTHYKKRRNNFGNTAIKTGLGLAGLGIGLGVGGAITDKLSKEGGVDVSGGVGAAAGFLPVIGGIAGAGLALKATDEFLLKRKRRRGFF